MTHPANGACVNRIVENWPKVKKILEERLLTSKEKEALKEFDENVEELKRLVP